ncbi:MAG: ABC transporter permease [Nocardioidaceae bacterium]
MAGLRTRRGSGLLLLPSLVWLLLFFLVPLGMLVVYSFGSVNPLTFEMAFGWTTENYSRLVDALYLKAILRSIGLTLTATLGCALLGFPVAYMISRASRRLQTLLLVAVIVPFWTSFVVRTYAISSLMSHDGIVTRFLRLLGVLGPNDDLLYTSWAVTFGLIYTYLPLMILPIYVALERIDKSLVEASLDLGLRPTKVLWRVIVPLARPGIAAGAVLVGIPATGEYVIPAILGGDKTLMMGNVVADQFLKTADYPFGSAVAVALMSLMVVVLFGARFREFRRGGDR